MGTTEWEVGSVQEVAWISTGFHRAGWVSRRNASRRTSSASRLTTPTLGFGSRMEMVNGIWEIGRYHQEWYNDQEGEQDVSVGTHPEGRPVVINDIKKDWVQVPKNLPAGEYVLSFRWDTAWG